MSLSQQSHGHFTFQTVFAIDVESNGDVPSDKYRVDFNRSI